MTIQVTASDIATLALVVSGLSLVVSLWRTEVARKNNTIAASAPWATLMMKWVETAVVNIHEDTEIFANICFTAFPDAVRKKELLAKLNGVRVQSQKTHHLLRTLAPDAA